MPTSSRILFILTATFAVGVTAIHADLQHSATQHESVGPDFAVHHPCTSHVAHDHGDLHDHDAILDMHRFVGDRFSEATERPETFGSVIQWTPDWELRWLDYEVGDHTIRLYHLTSRHNPERRYVSFWNDEHGRHTEWRNVH